MVLPTPSDLRPIHRHVRYWLAWVPGLYAAAIPGLFAVRAAQSAAHHPSVNTQVAVWTALTCAAVLALLLLGRAGAEADSRILKWALRAWGGSFFVSLAVGLWMLGRMNSVSEYGAAAVFTLLVFATVIPAQLSAFFLISELTTLPAPTGRPPPSVWSSLFLLALATVAFLSFLVIPPRGR